MKKRFILTFLFLVIALTSCQKKEATSSQQLTQTSNKTSITNKQVNNSSFSSIKTPKKNVDQAILKILTNGEIGFGDVKIGDPLEKIIPYIRYPYPYEAKYENFYCFPAGDGYILYYYNNENKKIIAGYIYQYLYFFENKGVDLCNNSIYELKQLLGEPILSTEGRLFKICESENTRNNDYVNYKKKTKLVYNFDEYILEFYYYNKRMGGILYKTTIKPPKKASPFDYRFEQGYLKALSNTDSFITVYKSPNTNNLIYQVGYVDLYLWSETSEKPIKIIPPDNDSNSFVGVSAIWSPNEKYFMLDCGTSSGRLNYIYSTEKIKEVGIVYSYLSKAIFTQDSCKIIFTPASKLPLKVCVENGETNNLAIFNIRTKKTAILEEGTADYYIVIERIIGNKLFYTRIYPETDKKETLSITL